MSGPNINQLVKDAMFEPVEVAESATVSKSGTTKTQDSRGGKGKKKKSSTIISKGKKGKK